MSTQPPRRPPAKKKTAVPAKRSGPPPQKRGPQKQTQAQRAVRTAQAKQQKPYRSPKPARPAPVKPPKRHYSSLMLYLWTALALPELVLHLSTAKNSSMLFSSGLILGPLFAVLPAFVMFVLATSLPGRRLNYLAALVYSLTAFALCASQLIYYRVFGTFYTFYSMTHGTGAFQFAATITTAIRQNLLTILLMAGPVLALIFGGSRRYYFRPRRALGAKLTILVIAIAVQAVTVSALPLLGGTTDTSVYGLYHNASDSYLSVNRLGLTTAFRLDVTRTLTGSRAGGSIVLEEPVPEDTTVPEDTFLAPLPTDPPETIPETTAPPETTEPLPTWDTSPNVLDIDFDTLIDLTTQKAVKEVHQYFASREPSNKNEKTGIFSGCNLILITAEAYSHLVVDPVRTPTLYKLSHEGISFTNFYVPDWGVSTTDGEYVHLTGTIPKDGVWSFMQSADNLMPLTMNQQLMARGYSSYAYHGHTYDYYGRDQYLTNLGYHYRALGSGLEVTEQWPESDVEVVDLSTGDYTGSTPFSVYYMTISGHREFTFIGNSMSFKNKAFVEDLPYSSNVRAYLACQMELENAMTLLLQRLEEAGVLENTVIVLTADHYPNGLSPEELGELSGSVPKDHFDLYKNGCFIYKPGMTPEVVDEPVSHLDLLPTLSNLFGLDFDSRLYMGRDVFSDAAPLVMFRDRSWITDQAFYDASTGKATFYGAAGTDEAYIKSINQEVGNRFAVSARILDYDYWRLLFGE